MQNLAEVLDDQAIIEEALANFAVLIDDLDFNQALELMGIGRFQFLRRKQMLIELRGLYMAIWRLALGRSFPQTADAMFTTFLRRYTHSHPDKIGLKISERAVQYWGMLQPSGDADFHNVARHLISFVTAGDEEPRALILKLALHIRSAYRFIFDRLI